MCYLINGLRLAAAASVADQPPHVAPSALGATVRWRRIGARAPLKCQPDTAHDIRTSAVRALCCRPARPSAIDSLQYFIVQMIGLP